MSVPYRTDERRPQEQAVNGFGYCINYRMNPLTRLPNRRNKIMLFTIAVILLVLWALGLASGTTIGGLVHILLVLAVIMVLFQLMSGRRVG